MFINGRPCTRGPIHKIISRAYKNAASVLDSAKEDIVDGGLGGLGMPQRKKRRREDSHDCALSTSEIENRHPIFLVMIRCPAGDCSFSASTDLGDDIFVA